MPHKEHVTRPRKSIPTKKSTLPESTGPTVDPNMVGQLRKEAWKWFKLRKAVPFCLAAVLGMFSFGGYTPVAKADTYVDYMRRHTWTATNTGNNGNPGAGIPATQWYWSWTLTSTQEWTNFNGGTGLTHYTFDGTTNPDGGIIAAINAAPASGGGNIVHIDASDYVPSADTRPTSTGSSTNPGVRYSYDGHWDGNTYNLLGNPVNIAADVTVRDERSTATVGQTYTIDQLTKNGAGVLILDSTQTAMTKYDSSVFIGNAGGLTVRADYSSTTATINNTFTGNVAANRTWDASTFTVSTGATFDKLGPGTLVGATTYINGTANMDGGFWNATWFDVGVSTPGVLNISAGTTNANNFRVGAGTTGPGTVTMTDGILNTGMGGGITEIGSLADGTITLTGSQVGAFTYTPTWNAQGVTDIGAGGDGVVTLNQYSRWNSTDTTNIGAGAVGDVYLNTGSSYWNAANQTVNVGQWSTGTVTMSDGTWLSGTTNVGLEIGSNGFVDQSGGTHSDDYANVGVSGSGIYDLSNGATWNTSVDAVIGVTADGQGQVKVRDANSHWTVTRNLTVAERGQGALEITNQGTVDVTNGFVNVGHQTGSNGSVLVDGSGSTLNINGWTAGNAYLVVGDAGTGDLTITNGGQTNVNTGNVTFGKEATGIGTGLIDGNNSELNLTSGNLIVADLGQADVTVSDGGLIDVAQGWANIGRGAGSDGTLTITGNGSRFYVALDTTVGDFGTGVLTVEDNALASLNGNLFTGNDNGGVGTTNIDSGATVDVYGNVVTGNHDGSSGYLHQSGGSTLNVRGTHTVGNELGSIGKELHEGDNTVENLAGDLVIGNAGQAGGRYAELGDPRFRADPDGSTPTRFWADWMGVPLIDGDPSFDPNTGTATGNVPGFAVVDGAVVTVGTTTAPKTFTSGKEATGYGYFVVDDRGGSATRATIDVTGTTTIGEEGDSYGRVLNGGQFLSADKLVVAMYDTSEATLEVTGTHPGTGEASLFEVTRGGMTIAQAGIGNLIITGGGITDILDGDVIFAEEEDSKATGLIEGPGSQLNIHGTNTRADLTVGNAGHAVVDVKNGGLVDLMNGDMVVGNYEGSYGEVNVDGNGSTVWINEGSLTVAYLGDKSNMNISNGGHVQVQSNGRPSGGYMTIADQPDVHGSVSVSTNGTLYVEKDLIVGDYGIGELTGNGGNINIGGTLITGHQTGSVGTVTVTGMTMNIAGDDIIAHEEGSFGHQIIDGIGAQKNVDGTQWVGMHGNAGGHYVYYPREPWGTVPVLLVDPSQPPPMSITAQAWFSSPNMTWNPYDNMPPIWTSTPNWEDYQENAPGLAITFGAKEQSGWGKVAALENSYGYVLIDNRGNNTFSSPATWDVENDLLIGGEGEAYVRVINGGQLNVGMNVGTTGDGFLIVGQNGDGNEGGTLRVGGISGTGGNIRQATVTVESYMTVGQERNAEGNLYAYDQAQITVGTNLTLAEKQGSMGRAHFDGNQTHAVIGETLTVAEAGISGGRYVYVPYTYGASDPKNPDSASNHNNLWWDSPNTLVWQTQLAGSGYENNAPGMAITNQAVVESNDGIVAHQRGTYGYVVIDNTTAGNGGPAAWKVTDNLTVADAGEAYMRIINGGQAIVGGDMTVAAQAGSVGTVRVNSANPERTATQRATLEVGGNLVIAEEGFVSNNLRGAVGDLYATDRARVTVGGDMTIADGDRTYGRAHFDGNDTIATIDGALIVANAGISGQQYFHIAGAGDSDDPTHSTPQAQWLDSDNTLLPLRTGSVGLQNNMPGMLISDGAVVNSGPSIVANQLDSYGYVVIDDFGPSATRAQWNVNGPLTVGNIGDAFLRVLGGGLLDVSGDMIVANGDGAKDTTATVRVNGYNPNTTPNVRSTLDVGGSLTIANETNTVGDLYMYDWADGNVDQNMTIAVEADSYGRAHIDQSTLEVGGMLTVGLAGQAGKQYKYQAGLYEDQPWRNEDDPDRWFDSDETLNPLKTGSFGPNNNAPGLSITRGSEVTSGSGMIGEVAGSTGYVVIDGREPLGSAGTLRSSWIITDTAPPTGATLTIADDGWAYVRVNHGGLLDVQDGSLYMANDVNGDATLRVYGVNLNGTRSELNVGGEMITAKAGVGNFYLYDRALANIADNYTIAQEVTSYGRAHIDGYGTELFVHGGTLTVGDAGQAGQKYQYVAGRYNPDTGTDAYDPARWFDDERTLTPLNTADPNFKQYQQNNMPGLLISRGAAINTDYGLIGVEATGVGYVVIDGRNPTTAADARTQWTVNEDLMVGDAGWAYVRVNHGALLGVDGDLMTANQAGSQGTVRVYGYNRDDHYGQESQLLVGGNMTTGGEGKGDFYLYDLANSTVNGDYTIAAADTSFGRAHIDGSSSTEGKNTWMRVDGTVTVGQYGQAGGVHTGASGAPQQGDPAQWFDSLNTLVDLETGDPNLLRNAPGLAITAGAQLSSGYGKAAEFDGSNGYVVIDGKGADGFRTWWQIDKNMNFGEAGNAYGRVFNGALLEVGIDNGGNMIIADKGTATSTLDVYGSNSVDGRTQLIVHGDLTTAKEGGSKGNLYAFRQAEIIVDGNHIIADEADSLGRDYIDEAGTTMDVGGRLTVGNAGQAGGTYTENRYDPRFGAAAPGPVTGDETFGNLTTGDPAIWFNASERTMDLVDTTFAQNDVTTGNAPGMAITRGAQVTSGSGMVGNVAGSNGYVVIDNKANTDPTYGTRTQWVVEANTQHVDADGHLTIANAGTGFVRVLNGSLLQTDSLTVNGSGGDGSLHVVGNGAQKDADGNYVQVEGKDLRPLGIYHGMYTALEPYGYRTEWINKGAAVLGETTGAAGLPNNGTIRINDGGYGETYGLYIGLAAGSEGTVSVKGAGSLLRVYEDTSSPYIGSKPAGSSTLSVSDRAWVSMEENSVIYLNGNAMFSTASVLHLEGGATLDAMTDRVSVVNARIEGGTNANPATVTGQKGVHITQDDVFTVDPATGQPYGQAEIDPGLVYSWAARCEDELYYGTLVFGDQLIMSGNVITYFDVNSGFDNGNVTPDQDHIIVKRGTSPGGTVGYDPIVAELSGTLKMHARLTDYYEDESDVLVVKTEGDALSSPSGSEFVPGRILSMYDELEIVPERFFIGRSQEIRKDAAGNDDLYVQMTLNHHPFEGAGNTYNTQQTGRGLDSIYAERNQDWLPFLRHFWYLGDPAFLNGFKNYGGEVRAHSLMLPLRNPWFYIPNRVDGAREAFHSGHTPCDQTDFDVECSRFGQYRRQFDKYLKGTRLWGSFILESENMGTDGNAYGYDLHRYGIAVGVDHNLRSTDTYVGLMLAYDEGRLNTYRAGAKAEDFNFGLYHRTRFQRDWEWKNYLGVGYQQYNMWRDVELNLTPMEWNDVAQKYECHDEYHAGRLASRFNGYSMAASTELSREFFFGCKDQWTVKPFMALDLNGFWQGSAREANRFSNYITDNTDYFNPATARYVALDYNRTSDVRVYWRPGIGLERAGRHGNLRALVSYSFRLGGHGYTSVDNQFRYGGEKFNIRGVDDGIGFVTVNLGGGVFLDRKKTSMASIDYRVIAGEHSTAHALQLGAQKKF